MPGKKYRDMTSAFIAENSGVFRKTEASLARQKTMLKNARRERNAVSPLSDTRDGNREKHMVLSEQQLLYEYPV